MRKSAAACPDWSWWIRSGERLALGLPVREALAAGGGAGDAAAAIAQFQRLVDEGNGMVAAFRQSGIGLPAEAWSLLEAGEYAGRLGEAMSEVGEQLRDRQRRRRELAGQLWYPALVLGVGMLVMLVILLWVIPQMREVSLSMGQGGRLPWISTHIGALYGWIFLAGAGGLAALPLVAQALAALGRRNARWAGLEERFHAGIGGWGQFRHWRREARLYRQLGTLLHSGVTLPRAIEIAAKGAGNAWEREQLGELRRRLLMGAGFTDSLRECPLVSPDNRPLLQLGQETGRLDQYCQRLARDLDDRLNWRLNQAVRLLEPVFLLGLSAAIGGLLLAYLLPMVRMLEQLA